MTSKIPTVEQSARFTAFAGHRRVASGSWAQLLADTKRHLDAGGEPVLIFGDETGNQIDVDFRGTLDEVLVRAGATDAPRIGPGRPKLGVTSREVSLMPRHWEWLAEQPNGVSATLRRLVDAARKTTPRSRQLRDAAYRFIWAVAGNFENAEDAIRALYAKEDARLETLIERWPSDIREHVLRLVAEAGREDEALGT
jgi:uncharacterized protein